MFRSFLIPAIRLSFSSAEALLFCSTPITCVAVEVLIGVLSIILILVGAIGSAILMPQALDCPIALPATGLVLARPLSIQDAPVGLSR